MLIIVIIIVIDVVFRSEKLSFYRPSSRGNSCVDGSQSESIPESPKQSSICGNVQSEFHFCTVELCVERLPMNSTCKFFSRRLEFENL